MATGKYTRTDAMRVNLSRAARIRNEKHNGKPEDRFWRYVQKTEDCWQWIGHRNHHGYGDFSIVYKRWKAHRYSWFLVNGPIPDGMKICHRCDNTSCVNPEHLFLGTQRDNIQDAIKKGRVNPRQRLKVKL